MCQPKAKGGQRCPSHTRLGMLRAQMTYEKSPTRDNYDRVIAATDEYASTPAGHQSIMEAATVAAANGDEVTAQTLHRTMEKGKLMRERTKAIEQALGVKMPPDYYAPLNSAGAPIHPSNLQPRNLSPLQRPNPDHAVMSGSQRAQEVLASFKK